MTWCAGIERHAAHAVCEATSAHVVKNQAEAAYFRSDLFDQRRQLIESWARFATTAPAAVLTLTS